MIDQKTQIIDALKASYPKNGSHMAFVTLGLLDLAIAEIESVSVEPATEGIALLDELAKVIVQEAINRHVGKECRLDAAVEAYMTEMRGQITRALIGGPQ